MLDSTVRDAAVRFGDLAAFVTDAGWPLSYAELDRLSDEAGAGLIGHGMGEGSVVALLMPSTVDYVVAYVAASKVGAAVAGVNPRLAPPEQRAVLDTAAPDLILTTVDLAGGATGVACTVVTVEPADRPDGILRNLRVGGVIAQPVAHDPTRLATVVFTSGTTGAPKGAAFTVAHLEAVTRLDVGLDRWGGGGPMLASTQFAHVGFMTKLPWYLRLGSTIHLLDRWRADDVLRLVARTRMASIGGVAPQVALLLRSPLMDELDLSRVETLVVGGAASPPALVAEAQERFGAKYSIRYSSTESGGVGLGTAFGAPDDEAFHTIGRPRPGVEARVVDDDGIPAPDGQVGELCLRSPAVMAGYWRDPEATAQALRDGWLHTGDLAMVDASGCFRLAGRRSEMFIRGGYNVHPQEVEAVLSAHPGVVQVAVVPRHHDVMGEVGVAVVVPASPAEPPALDDLRRFAAHHLAHHKLPEAVVTVEALPLTSMQKVDRAELRALVAEQPDAG